jgi:two-component system, NtrC family, sensor kinase
MHFEFILLIILFNYLRKKLQSKILLPQWDRIFQYGMFASIALLVIDITVRPLNPFMPWIAHAMMLSLIYVLLRRKEFQPVKSLVYAVLPVILVNFTTDVTKLINKKIYDSYNNYFDTAYFFAIAWLVAMLIINSKQRKALEKEQLKAAEREKEFRLSESMKTALEVQVAERTAALTLQTKELQQTLTELKATQDQLIQAEKMASLGELTAGIAHEIQNPLNFVNNFSELNAELIAELNDEIAKGNFAEVKNIAGDIAANEEKINHHGKRADAIVKGMLLHSRRSSDIKESTDINKLADEYLRLAYHGLRAKDKSFNATMKTEFDETIGSINIIPQDMGRVILNLITNAFYAVTEKKKAQPAGYEPTVTVSTKKTGNKVYIRVQDNGNGVPQKVIDKIFQPFFTTKPTGEGTGLGLSMSYDIVTKAHGGELKVETKDGEGAAFSIIIPS